MGLVFLGWKDSLRSLLNCVLPLIGEKSFEDDRFKEHKHYEKY